MSRDTISAQKTSKPEKMGFFKRLFGRDVTQRRAYRQLKRELSHARIDLYKIKHDLIQTGIAKLLYDIYKLTYPFKQVITLDSSTKRFLPSFDESFVLSYHDEAEIELYNKLTEEYIRKLVTKYGVKKTTEYIEKLVKEYFDQFDTEKAKQINAVYTNFLGFVRFAKFDFYPILREFDPDLEEGNFIKKPSFGPAEGSFLRNDLLKLHKALYAFDVDKNLDEAMDVFKKVKNFEPISRNNFNKLKNIISSFQKHNYIPLIIRAIDKNPSSIPMERMSQVNVMTSFSHKRRGDVYAFLNSIKNKIKEDSVSSLVSQLFSDEPLQRVKNYNEQKNDQFKNLGLPVFKYVNPLNYVKAFNTDKYKIYINDVINELIVSGIFINKEVLNDLSNSYYALNSHLKEISEFENDLDTEGTHSRTIKRLLYTVKKDTNARNILEKTINTINTKAKILIDEEVMNVKQMAICLKNVLEDYKKKTPAIVSNIKKLRMNNNAQFIEELLTAYKDIYLFLKLLGNFVALNVSKSEIEKQKFTIKE